MITFICLFNFFSCYQQKTFAYQVQEVFAVDGVIWGFDHIDQNKVIYTKRKGEMWVFDNKVNNHQLIANVPDVYHDGQGGLLDVVLHPEFEKNNWVYLSYSVQVNQSFETRIARAKLIKNKLENLEVLFTSNTGSTHSIHFGSRIVFDGQGFIFFTVGDRGQRERAQDLLSDNGKVYRMKEDGVVPTDNPFTNQKGVNPLIWSYGHRNPQGLYFDITKGELWEQEHGPRGGDEINLIQKGKNYGWPVITYGREYHGPKIGDGSTHRKNMEQPMYYYVPSIAPCGLSMYFGNAFPEIKGAFLSGALAGMHLNLLVKNGGSFKELRWLTERNQRVRNVKVVGDDIYISTDSGQLIRVFN